MPPPSPPRMDVSRGYTLSGLTVSLGQQLKDGGSMKL